MNAIYAGHVAHMRPGKHRLRYPVFMLTLDLDDVPNGLKRFKHNRPALFSLFDRDHAGRCDAPLKPQIETKLRDAGISWDDGRIVLLSMPRLFNYVFNPLSVYFCYRHDDSVAALVHEVSNTFGDSHFYVLPPRIEANGNITQSCAKEFFVSPFLEGGLHYEFNITPPGERVAVSMIVRRGKDVALTASFSGARRGLTDARLFRVWLGNPLMTFKVIAGIHWEAVLMMLKGVRYLGRGAQIQRQEQPSQTVDREEGRSSSGVGCVWRPGREDRCENLAQEMAQPPEQQAEIVASAGEHGVGGVAVTPGEMIAIHAVL